MTNIAHHIRIFEPSPTDDYVTKRVTVVSAVADNFKKRRSYGDLFALANDIATVFSPRAHLTGAIAVQVADVISKESPSFDKDERQEEVDVCAALGGLNWLEGASNSAGNPSSADVFAMALWSALSFQKASTNAKLEKLRQELIKVARELVLGSAETARQRTNVVDSAFSLAEGDQAAQIEKKIKDTVVKAVNALRVNAALDREEIDVLWWALDDWSTTGRKRYSDLGAEEAILAGAVELTKLLKRLPADMHRHLVMRHVANTAQKRDLPGFLEKLGDTRGVVAVAFQGNALLDSNPHVFPLLSALGSQDRKSSGEKISRNLDEWGARALLEAGMVHLSTLPTLIS
jgi:hypothetical protein